MSQSNGSLISNYNLSPLVLNFNKRSDNLKLANQAQGIWLSALDNEFNTDTDFVVFIVAIDAVSDEFSKAWSAEEFDLNVIGRQVEAYADKLKELGQKKKVLVFTWASDKFGRSDFLSDMKKPWGRGYLMHYVNNKLIERLSDSKCIVLDTMVKVAPVVSDKSYFLSKQPFSLKTVENYATAIYETLTNLEKSPKKVLVLDLDNTLWGGVVGDDGWKSLDLGGHSHIGEAYKAFQAEILSLKRKGIVLALVSKNTESVAIEAIEKHPEMLIKLKDISAYRINWDDKAKNIVDIANELNLGLQSFVFLDDSPIERGRVKESLSDIYVPDLPLDPTKFREFITGMSCFDSDILTAEDRMRTDQYKENKLRESFRESSLSTDDWLKNLQVEVRVLPLAYDEQRVAQLLNKTNQMNLTTRRLTEIDLINWESGTDNHLVALDVSDRFGKLGITGILSISVVGNSAQLIDMVLSCRAMGRGVESVMEAIACKMARDLGCSTLFAEFIPTKKNMPMKAFLDGSRANLFDENKYEWTDLSYINFPESVVINYE